MAILNGMIKKMSGSAGQLTFKSVNGQTVVSEKVTQVKNSRTSGQQHQRMKWVNIIHMYSGIAPLLKNGFEKKTATQSDYNLFVKLNCSCAPVYLTKPEADGGGCIAAPYQITQGSLPSIVISGTGADAKTDIQLGTALTITADTKVKEFAQAVVENNADYDYGDQISFYNILQQTNAETGIPYCQFSACSVVLDKDSNVKLWDQVNKAGFASVAGSGSNKVLGHGTTEGDGVFAWVHSRYDNGKTKVSTQFLIDNNSQLATYKSDAAYTNACKSYGGSSSTFLTPNETPAATSSDNQNQQQNPQQNATKYTVTLAASPSEGGTVSGGGQVDAGGTANISAVANQGYTFSGWDDGVNTANRTLPVNSDISLTANFTQDSNPDVNAGGGDTYQGTPLE